MGSQAMSDFTRAWGLCILIGLVGAFFLVMTYGALIASKKSGKHVSGVPFFGGLCIAVAFLLSPCKWLALLGLLDYGFWQLPYLLIKDLLLPKLFPNKFESTDADNDASK